MSGAGLPLRNAEKRRVPCVRAGRMWQLFTIAVSPVPRQPQISITTVTATPETEYGATDIHSLRTNFVRCDVLTAGSDAV